VERQLQHLDERYKVKTIDGLHDLLIRIGDLSEAEAGERTMLADVSAALGDLERARRAVPIVLAGERRYVAVEDIARYRDALGIPPPPGLPEALLEPVRDPAGDLAQRYARSHAPFTARELAARYGLGPAVAEALLLRLTEAGRLIEGEFRPGGVDREWCDPDVLRSLRRRSLAKLRQEIEAVDAEALGRFAVSWHGIGSGRTGLEPLLDAVEQLQGAAIPASVLEREILPARVENYEPAMLDTLMAAGEVAWIGVEPLGERDGRIALYLTDHMQRLHDPRPAPPNPSDAEVDERSAAIVDYLRTHGASFFGAIHQGVGGGFPNDTVEGLWGLVWNGLATNDTLHPLRAYVRAEDRRTRRKPAAPFRSRRLVPRTAEGRWSLVERSATAGSKAAATHWSAAVARQLLARYGVVTRETVATEAVAGGFSAIYQVLKAMEDAGRIRRGYFVAGLGAAQFALPAALDLLRTLRERPETPRTVVLSATDPANPYGAIVKWPELVADAASANAAAGVGSSRPEGRGPTRTVGALVILVDGAAAAYLRRGERELLLFAPEAEPRRSQVTRAVARMLLHLAQRRGMLLGEINGEPAIRHIAARLFLQEGFVATALGLQARTDALRPRPATSSRSREPGEPRGYGIAIAEIHDGGEPMADQNRIENDPTLIGNSRPRSDETRESEHDRVRTSNDRDQRLEREGTSSDHNRGYDEAVHGQKRRDMDPDRADADIDRDDIGEV
jgi:ATP-dependent Lhr-like helicase